MKLPSAISALIACAWGSAALAQAAEPTPWCVLAGRVTDAASPQARWAPRSTDVQLLDAQGRVVSGARAADLQRVTQLRVQRDALAATCVGQAALPQAADDESPRTRQDVPLIRAGDQPIAVVALATPTSRSGTWVEVKVVPPADRMVLGQRR
jgi:hypothetical protein